VIFNNLDNFFLSNAYNLTDLLFLQCLTSPITKSVLTAILKLVLASLVSKGKVTGLSVALGNTSLETYFNARDNWTGCVECCQQSHTAYLFYFQSKQTQKTG
jgi:hypothetical protein